VRGRPCLAYRWNSCPLHILELVSSHHLRDELYLASGDTVEVELNSLEVAALSQMQKIVWKIVWGHNLDLYYRGSIISKILDYMCKLIPFLRRATIQRTV